MSQFGGKSALELLERDEYCDDPLLSKIATPLLGAGFGFGSALLLNFANRKPLFSSIQYHVLSTIAGAFIGKIVEEKRQEHYARRDAVLRHYVELHPELFPKPERQKFADVFWPWNPIR